jgi:L-lactate dehydrogenase complex protein LldG
MKISPAKENILKRVRNALSQSVQLPFPNSEGNSSVFRTENESLELKFAEEFTRLQGKFVFCTGKGELMESLRALCENKEWHNVFCQTPALLKIIHQEELPVLNQGTMHEADAAITDCEYLVARTGTVVLSSAHPVAEHCRYMRPYISW